MKLFRMLIIVSILTVSFAFWPNQPLVHAECIQEFGNGGEVVWWPGGFTMSAGSSITITLTTVPGVAMGIIIWTSSGGNWPVVWDESTSAIHTYTFSVAETTQVELLLDWTVRGLPENTYSVFSSECAAGCDIMMPLPEQAVVGQFTSNSEIYWHPGEPISPPVNIEAGNTYYVAGQDASEQYYMVLVVCDWVWVRKETVGPNYDDVWNGKPLPADIVG